MAVILLSSLFILEYVHNTCFFKKQQNGARCNGTHLQSRLWGLRVKDQIGGQPGLDNDTENK